MRGDLERFVDLIRAWQRTHNLISRADLDSIWSRHVADSLQLRNLAPKYWRSWVDLGSGAGFPGVVIAIAAKEPAGSDQPQPTRRVTLVESNMKKAAFLRAVIRETNAPASVAAERIEAHAPSMAGQADVVSARALASLPALCALAHPYLHQDSVLLLLKGQDFVHEHEAASKAWEYDMITIPSVTNRGGQVVEIRNLRRKVRS